MNGERTPDPAATRRPLVILSLVLPPLLWGLGFLGSRLSGCGSSLALPKATAYALCGMAGWAAYLLIGRPGDLPFVMPSFAMVNVTLLNPTRTPWPFREMLNHGLVVTVALALFVALVMGAMRRAMKGVRPTPPAPKPVAPGPE